MLRLDRFGIGLAVALLAYPLALIAEPVDVLHKFAGRSGKWPQASLIADEAGRLARTGSLAILHSFGFEDRGGELLNAGLISSNGLLLRRGDLWRPRRTWYGRWYCFCPQALTGAWRRNQSRLLARRRPAQML